MKNMRFKVGDRVRIKSLDWYNKNKDINGNVHCGDKVFDNYMSVFCGSVVTIGGVYPYNAYDIQEDLHCRTWTDEMIECLVEPIDCKKCGLTRNSTRCLFMDNCPHNQPKNTIEIPKGWIPKDENGNVINATKIVLEKKKKEYPKTYEECEKVLRYDSHRLDDMGVTVRGYKWELIRAFQILLICRDAYWKLAGEDMGLGKPWEYDCNRKYYTPAIICRDGYIQKVEVIYRNTILAFPTPEMRDAFYENFKSEIESCKELL